MLLKFTSKEGGFILSGFKYFVARGKEGKIAFARAKADGLPVIGQNVSNGGHESGRFSLPDGDWIITQEMPSDLSDFLWALDTLDDANDRAHGESHYGSLAEDLANYVLSL